ncbi:MAG: hypothetical protein IPO81_27030 [Kouleothrix sp.]|nr:hypothetical protein [Kouleothrix sp.]
MSSSTDTRIFRYQIDALDRLVTVNSAFLAFAQENAGASLSEPSLLGRQIWDFIGDDETRLLYQLILGRVRGGRAMVVQLRCDSPAARRRIELHIDRLATGWVQFTSQIVEQHERDYMALLDESVPRTRSVISICSWCKRVQVPGRGWFEVEDALDLLKIVDAIDLPSLSNVVCYDCHHAILAAL